MTTDPKTLIPPNADPPVIGTPVKDMAYMVAGAGVANDPQIYKLRRGNLPTFRAGSPVTAVPRFRGVTLHSQVAGNAPAPFSSTNPNTNIAWPSR